MLTDVSPHLLDLQLLIGHVDVRALKHDVHRIEGEVLLASSEESGWRGILGKNVGQFQPKLGAVESDQAEDEHGETEEENSDLDNRMKLGKPTLSPGSTEPKTGIARNDLCSKLHQDSQTYVMST